MTEVRVSGDGRVAQRIPFDRDDGLSWLSWVFRDEMIDMELLGDSEVAEWLPVWPVGGEP